LAKYSNALKIIIVVLFVSYSLSHFIGAKKSPNMIDAGPPSPVMAALQNDIEYEFEQIMHPPHAMEIDHYSPKPHALSRSEFIMSTYSAESNYDQIRAYYRTEFKKHGWTGIRGTNFLQSGEYLGGRLLEYKKGELVAQLRYAGEEANYGWDYSISISWGLYNQNTP